jgi:hypothetical protein
MMHSQQQQPSFKVGRMQSGHYNHLDAQKVAETGPQIEALVDQYATVSLPPKIQRPVGTPLRNLSDSAMAN